MNKLSQFLVESILEENKITNKVVVYAGRFQPFHKGHYAAYQHLVNKFGKDNVYIGTSDKTDTKKSPFKFSEKKMIMTTMFGVPSNRIVQVKNPYAPVEILSKFDENTTAFITSVGGKDADRLTGKYFQLYKDDLPFEGYKDRGYVYVTPMQSGSVSGTEVRKGLRTGTIENKKEFFTKRAYGKYNEKIFNFIVDRLAKLPEVTERYIYIPEYYIEQWLINNQNLITEVSKINGSTEVDDGPNYVFPDVMTYDVISRRRAEHLGFTVLNQLIDGELSDIDDYPTYPSGPVKAVTPYPAGVAGKITATNQKDYYGDVAYTKWYNHVTRAASLVGYSLVNSLQNIKDREISLRTLGNERMTEDINIPVKVGDTILTGKFKNKKTVVKTIGKDEHGMPTINGKKAVNFRMVNESNYGINMLPSSMGIARKDMPQILSKDVGDYISYLRSKGISVTPRLTNISKLGMTQRDINIQKVKALLGKDRQNLAKPVIVSSDGYILDGHHRIIALYNLDNNFKLKTIRVNLSINDLLKITKQYPRVFFKNIDEVMLNEIPMSDLVKIDQYADKQMNPVDVVITHKHFFDRLNDPRNVKPISQAELVGFFKRLAKAKEEFLGFLKKYGEIVAKDNRTNINIPFMKQANKIIGKTIMRKPDFKSSNYKYKFENTNEKYAIFKIFHGKKNWVVGINKNDTFGTYDNGVRYSDKSVLKFSKEKAVELVNKNKGIGKFGIVGSDGKQVLIENLNEAISKESIINYYNEICKAEGYKPLPVKFGSVKYGGANVTFNPTTFKPLYITFDLGRMKDPEYAVLHEFTHQIMLERFKDPFIGKRDQSAKFKKVENRLLEKYLYSDYSNLLFEVLTELTKGSLYKGKLKIDGNPIDVEVELLGADNTNKTFITKVIHIDKKYLNRLPKDGILNIPARIFRVPGGGWSKIKTPTAFENLMIGYAGSDDLKDKEREVKRLRKKFDKERCGECVIQEGGAYGHMSHPFDVDINLTFGQLKDIANKALDGKLEFTREKTDGQAIAVSWKDGKLVAARNKGHLKNRGEGALDIKGIASKFAGRGELEKAYNFAMRDLSKAIGSLSEKQRVKIFKDGACFMNLEVIYPTSVNVIPYGQALLIFHGTMEYDMDGNAIGENQGSARMLAGMIKQVNQNVQDNYTIQGPPVVELPKNKNLSALKSKYISQINKLQSEFKLKDSDGVSEYHKAWWEDYIDKNVPSKVDNQIKEGLVNRWALNDKSFRLDSKNINDDKVLNWAKKIDKEDLSKISKDNIRKFEDIFLGMGAEILSFMKSAITVNPDAAVRDMKSRLEQTIKDVEKSGDIKKINKLKLELERLRAVGGMDKIVPNEGIVFVYNGHTMKLTGSFASINQVLGLFYG